MQNGTRLAAVDLGSNSFRLEIGVVDHGQFLRTEYLKETVRQGSGLDDNRNLTPEALQRGWDCLSRFGERLAGFKPYQIRAVATQTLREARNRDDFLARGRSALGFPIDVISGREEARLIYQGVAHNLPQSTERRLVIDIGGRSTELALGQTYEATVLESYRVGSIAWSNRYFPQGSFNAHAFEAAEIAAKAVLDEALTLCPRDAWDTAYGSAGTVGAVGDVLTAAGWPGQRLTRDGLDWLQERLIRAQSVDRLRIEGMREERKAVIGGGLSILRAIFDLLKIDEMQTAVGGLRHGLLFDLMATPESQSDVRGASVQRLVSKFGVDELQCTRVANVGLQLLRQLEITPTIETPATHPIAAQRLERKLVWAARLHEIGCQISHSDYHKHGAYIIDHVDAIGFAQTELHRLSLLILGHRGKLRKLETELIDESFVRQLLALRLAVLICHARRDPDLDGMKLSRRPDKNGGNAGNTGNGGKGEFELRLRAGWAESFPQSAHLLREECVAWQKSTWSLTLVCH